MDGRSHCFLLGGDGGFVLVDTGLRATSDRASRVPVPPAVPTVT